MIGCCNSVCGLGSGGKIMRSRGEAYRKAPGMSGREFSAQTQPFQRVFRNPAEKESENLTFYRNREKVWKQMENKEKGMISLQDNCVNFGKLLTFLLNLSPLLLISTNKGLTNRPIRDILNRKSPKGRLTYEERRKQYEDERYDDEHDADVHVPHVHVPSRPVSTAFHEPFLQCGLTSPHQERINSGKSLDFPLFFDFKGGKEMSFLYTKRMCLRTHD